MSFINFQFLKSQAGILALLAALTFLVYFPVLQNDFTNWDDKEYIVNNPAVHQITPENLKQIFTTTYIKNWHPLTMFSYMLEAHFFGLKPFVFHLTNLILHLANTLLVFFLLRLLMKNESLAWIAALLFGIHPMHVESVAWIAERKDVLFTFFYLIALIQYVAYTKKPSLIRFLAVALLFVCSGLSKVTAVSFPLIVILIDAYQRRKINLAVVLEKIPLFVISIVLGIIILKTHSDVLLIRAKIEEVPNLLDRILFSSYGLVFYLSKIFWPVNLSAVYPYPQKMAGVFPQIYGLSPGILLIAVLLISYWYQRTKDRDIIFAGSFFVLTIFLNLPFSVIGEAITADRYIYLPCVGVFILVYKMYAGLRPSSTKAALARNVLGCMAIGYLVFLSILAFQRTFVWRDSVTLWTDTIRRSPQTGFLYYTRGNAYFEQQEYQQAVKDYTRALELSKVYFVKDILANRANAYGKLERYHEAIGDLTLSLRLKPHVGTFHNRALAYTMVGEEEKAIADINSALQINPFFADGYAFRATLALKKGDVSSAFGDLNRAIEMDPKKAFSYYARSRIFLSLGNFKQALSDVLKARELGFPVDEEYIQFLNKALPK
jgi:tetratricopeptide (TPR) repeat protein